MAIKQKRANQKKKARPRVVGARGGGPRGVAVHIGLNKFDEAHYGSPGTLNACEYDAQSMQEIAKRAGYSTSLLLTRAATRQAVRDAVHDTAKGLKAGDTCLISYAGHGGFLPDKNGDEPDGQDETWCLYDGQMVDDELYELWGAFGSGVRVLVVSDSCHSGSVSRLRSRGVRVPGSFSRFLDEGTSDEGQRYRALTPQQAARAYHQNKKSYDKYLAATRGNGDPKACIRLYAGCQDTQLSLDGVFNGAFTGALMRVWDEGKFKGDHEEFVEKVARKLPPTQVPRHSVVGTPDASWNDMRPFVLK